MKLPGVCLRPAAPRRRCTR
uniref:Hamster beta-adrenergic receptor n=1 Tax=Mesocricetus auratus TaxID=10036 RepID=A2NU44_MESAU|nr:unnamed protein product [Mesocricetus auratus]